MYYIKYLKSGVFVTFINANDWVSEIRHAVDAGIFADRFLDCGPIQIQTGYSALLKEA